MRYTAIIVWVIGFGIMCMAHGQRAEANGDWIVTTDTNPIDSVRTVTAVKGSVENPASLLVIRCRGKHAAVYVDAHEVVSSEYGVRIKFDQDKASKQSWERATSYDALFSPAAGDFLRNMKSAKRLYFEYTPYGRAPRVVSFDVGNPPESIYAACVTSEIEKADSRAKKAANDRARLFAQEKQERENGEKRSAALRANCAVFADESLEKVERSQSPLPPQECWEVLEWMHGSGSYEDLAKRRELCKLPSFANDPKFCGAEASSSAINASAADADQKLIIQSIRDPAEKSALKNNCSHRWFSDSHPKACNWANSPETR